MKKLTIGIFGLLLANLVYGQLVVNLNENYSTVMKSSIASITETASGVNEKGYIYIEEVFVSGVKNTYLFNNDSVCFTQVTWYPIDIIPDLLRSFKEYEQFNTLAWLNPKTNIIFDAQFFLEYDVLRILIYPYDEKLLEGVGTE
jgi:hypothetical protein